MSGLSNLFQKSFEKKLDKSTKKNNTIQSRKVMEAKRYENYEIKSARKLPV